MAAPTQTQYEEMTRIADIDKAIHPFRAASVRLKMAANLGATAGTYKYGMHIGNWTDGGSDGLVREVQATVPVAMLHMANVKPEKINHLAGIVKARRGTVPYLVFRIYADPEGGFTGAEIEDYISTYKIQLATLLEQPVVREVYNAGKLICKPFNETNIGGEGFPRGRAGFAAALVAWKWVRNALKAAYPLIKVVSLCNTPGNDDVYFGGDAVNAPYWYHGQEAAKANPTAAEIAAAVLSCPMKEMFELCDFIGIHVYAQNEKQTKGSDYPYFAGRHEQALKFLTPYTAAGKKMIISECDICYDEPGDTQARRAELFVWWLANKIATNPAILFINHWWNADDQEGAATWEKHQTRKGGVFRQIVHAIKAYFEGAAPPVDPPTNPPTEPPVTVPPTGAEIDFKGLPLSIVIPPIAAGQWYWAVKKAVVLDPVQGNNLHHIFARVWSNGVRQVNRPVKFSWPSGSVTTMTEAKPLTELGDANLAMAGSSPSWNPTLGPGPYNVEMGELNIPTYKVRGMGMPTNNHFTLVVEFELRQMPTTPPPPTDDVPLPFLKVQAQANQLLRLNPNAALQKRGTGTNTTVFVPTSQEWEFAYTSKTYVAQRFERLGDGRVGIAYCVKGDWGNIKWQEWNP